MPAEPAAATDSTSPGRTLPVLTEHNEPFWTGGSRGELVVQRCRRCRGIMHPATVLCHHDHSPDLAWETVSGRGSLETWTETRHQWFPGIEPPYVVALVALAEDPRARLLTNLVDLDGVELRVGLELEVCFEHLEDDEGSVWLPMFRPSVRP